MVKNSELSEAKWCNQTQQCNNQYKSQQSTQDIRYFCEQMNLKNVRFMIKSGKSVFDNCKVLNSVEG